MTPPIVELCRLLRCQQITVNFLYHLFRTAYHRIDWEVGEIR